MKRVLILYILFLIALPKAFALAYEEIDASSKSDVQVENTEATNDSTEKKSPWVVRTILGIIDFFMAADSNYVDQIPYDLKFHTDVTMIGDVHHLHTTSNDKNLVVGSPLNVIGTVGLSYSIIGYGLSYNLSDLGRGKAQHEGTDMKQNFMINTSKVYAEYFYYHSTRNSKVMHMTGEELSSIDRSRNGISTRNQGAVAMYFFNNMRYSWPSASDFSAKQAKSSGSWSAGVQFNHMKIAANKARFDADKMGMDDNSTLFNKIYYTDFGVNAGYHYNYVFNKDFMLGCSAVASLNYRDSELHNLPTSNAFTSRFSDDVTLRAGLYWNNLKYFSGLLFELHSYFYHEKPFWVANTYANLTYSVGFNFW